MGAVQEVAATVRIPLPDRMGVIKGYALVDEGDAEQAQYRWHRDTDGYAIRGAVVDGRQTTVVLHREILGLKHGDGLQGDHINRDRLDCRRLNLRVVTPAQNHQNVAAKPNTASEHRGVSWFTALGKWKATARLDRATYHLGYFDDEDQAAAAAARWRAEHMPFSEEAMAGWKNGPA